MGLAVLDEQLTFLTLTVLKDSMTLYHNKVGSNYYNYCYNGKGKSVMVIAKISPCFRWPLLTSNLC